MSILREFEGRLEGAVEGLFSKTFRSGVQPVELAKRILRTMDSQRTTTATGIWAPNHYVLRLSATDFERFAAAEGVLSAELKLVIRDGAREGGWGLVGPPHVTLQQDAGLKRGDIACEASLVEGHDPGPAAGDPGGLVPEGAELTLVSGGRRTSSYPLTKIVAVMGRHPECDIRLDDPASSRRHAEIRHAAGRWSLVDLSSTNGTLVNGSPVTEVELQTGDRITIGQTVLEFAGGGRA